MKYKVNGSRLVPVLLVLVLGITGVTRYAHADDKPLSDKMVKQIVEHRLEKHKLLTNNNIQVTVKDSVITLDGTVPTLNAKQKAEDDAREAEESYQIVNNLTIPSNGMTAQQLAENVVGEIQRTLFYSVFDWITVQVKNDTVTLRGWVYQPWHKGEFQDQVERVRGVNGVINDIKVLPASPLDDQIRSRAARVIYNDPSFQRYAYQLNPPIHIIVNDGKVTLYGVVDSQFDRNWVAQLVRSRTDAFSVDNQLEVSQ